MSNKTELAELKDIEIFEAGTYRGRAYTDADLDTMVSNFSALKDEIKPVAVIGHDEDQELLKKSGLASAGWMESVRKVGKKLVASFKDVPKVLAEIINRGAFKRISSEIYNDYNGKGLALRRVAILGGDIPEVKTLKDIAALYSDSPEGNTTWVTLSEAAPKKEDAMTAEELAKMQADMTKLSEQVAALTKERDDLKAAQGTPAPKQNIFDMDVTDLAEKVASLTEEVTKMKESDKAKDAKINALEEQKNSATEKFSEVEAKRKREDIHRFISDRFMEGRISPAIRGMGLEQFMSNLDDSTVTRFGEGKRTQELTPLGFMKALFLQIPKNSLVKLGEMANTGGDPNEHNTGKTAAERLSEATKKIMAAEKIKLSEAFIKAQQENPELATEYAADMVVS